MEGELYVVATPIGNLGDMVPRAVDVLHAVDLIAAEDTRHSGRLLKHLGVETSLTPYHDHGDDRQMLRMITALESGQKVALISDAGTPLISDPGYKLVREARLLGIRIIPIPGPCAVIAALSASGMPSDRFSFEGFLPHKSSARIKKFEGLVKDSCTLIFYESPHRIVEALADMAEVFGSEREVVMARELTKTYETFLFGSLASVHQQVTDDLNQQKGEIVLILRGADEAELSPGNDEKDRILRLLMDELPLKQAAALAAKVTGGQKNALYQRALELKE
jgi:16S rRNA (cytidine1402-2'-O)-methyltransferase